PCTHRINHPLRLHVHPTLSLSSLSSRSARFLCFFNHPPTTDIYTLSLHDALPISMRTSKVNLGGTPVIRLRKSCSRCGRITGISDRKSTRLNSSHVEISYAVFCLKKKKITR